MHGSGPAAGAPSLVIGGAGNDVQFDHSGLAIICTCRYMGA
jgi:hypothetical protein